MPGGWPGTRGSRLAKRRRWGRPGEFGDVDLGDVLEGDDQPFFGVRGGLYASTANFRIKWIDATSPSVPQAPRSAQCRLFNPDFTAASTINVTSDLRLGLRSC